MVGAVIISAIIIWPHIVIRGAQEVADILAKEQEPCWLTAGSIALSNLSTTPPSGAEWWWDGKVAFVFIRYRAARFSVDALERSFLWEDGVTSATNNGLTGRQAAAILHCN